MSSFMMSAQEAQDLADEEWELEKQRQRFYGFTLEEWNSMTENEQIAIQDRAEYRAQHADQAEWGLKD